MESEGMEHLEEQIAQWRGYVLRRGATDGTGVKELERRLRGQVTSLIGVGLESDEAFLVAVKRIGELDGSTEGPREHVDRVWKHLATAPDVARRPGVSASTEFLVVVGLAIGAALAIKAPELFGFELLGDDDGFYFRNLSLFVLPFLAGYYAWKRGLDATALRWLAPLFIAAVVFANVYPFTPSGATEVLTGIHLPIFLWLVVGVAYLGGEWRSSSRRMDFVRFSGELFIYYVLIAAGGGVLTALTVGLFSVIGLEIGQVTESWLLPCGAVGAVIIGAWLVEAKQGVVENIVPVLTRVFTPLFAVALLAFLATLIWTRNGIDVEREALIGFDLLLVLVLGMLLYSVSARDHETPPNVFDVLQVVLVISALVIDVIALWAIAGRISEFGFSANKVAALGENLILLVNLAWSAWLYFRFLRRRGSVVALERWQTAYLPVYGVWAAVVVVGFPPVFGWG
jgi:hypothetical protein